MTAFWKETVIKILELFRSLKLLEQIRTDSGLSNNTENWDFLKNETRIKKLSRQDNVKEREQWNVAFTWLKVPIQYTWKTQSD